MKTTTNILGGLVLALGVLAGAAELPGGLTLGAPSLEALELEVPALGSVDTTAVVRQQLEKGLAAWQKFCEQNPGGYEYDVVTRMPMGAVFETTVVVRHNQAVARKVRILVHGMRMPNETDTIASYVETLEKKTLLSHRHGAAPKTMDELYVDALAALRQPLRPSECWQCQVDDTTGALLFLDKSPAEGTVLVRPDSGLGGPAPGLSLRQTVVLESDPQGGARAPLLQVKDFRPWDGKPVDDALARSLLERLAISRLAWRKFSDACQGNYEYDVVDRYATGDTGTTTFAVSQGWSIGRRWQLVPPPGVTPDARDEAAQLKLKTQIRLLEPTAQTIDQIYQRAFTLLEGGIRSHEEWSASFDDHNLLKSIGYRDRRLGEAAPFVGARIDALRPDTEWLNKYDLDGNGRIDAREALLAERDARHRTSRKQRRYDLDGDGQVDEAEMKQAQQQKAAGILAPVLEE